MSELGQLQFADLVRPDLVLYDVVYPDRDSALQAMAQTLVDRGFCEDGYVSAILEREHAHPSALPMPGHKIAIPHTDATYVKSSALLFARLREPVTFFSMGDPNEALEVSMISMFALKEKKLIGDLLETLITVYQDESVLDAICEAQSSQTIYEILKRGVEAQQKRAS